VRDVRKAPFISGHAIELSSPPAMFRERLGTQSLAGHFGDMKVWSHSLHYIYEGSFNGLHMSSFADLETVSCDLQHISLGLISPIRFSFRYWSVRPQ
jgi:hypothetical protein